MTAPRIPEDTQYRNIVGREPEYTPEKVEAEFKAANNYSNKCEILRTAVEVAKKKDILQFRGISKPTV